MASGSAEKKLKGVYLVPDPLMMKPHFGPSEHIKVGIEQLKKYFDIDLLILGENLTVPDLKIEKSLTKGRATNNGFVGLLRDVKLYIKSNRTKSKLKADLIKREAAFIYERGQYLDFRGVNVAQELGIPHFYEVNWLNYLGIRQFYFSWFNPLARIMEERAYSRSSLNFFIGTQHRLIEISSDKVHVIQNGIHDELMNNNYQLQNIVKDKVSICYVANLMPHHRFEVFLDALKIAKVENRIVLHMIGYHFEKYADQLPKGLEFYLHGPKRKEELPALMKQCNVGLISGGPSYSSFMKLFEYAAFKMCVVCPDLENIQLMFSQDEIVYFKTDDADSLANQLQNICTDHAVIPHFGNNIFSKVKEKYTWEKIYADVKNQMQRKMTL